MTKKLNINAIILDLRLQSRVNTDEEIVKEYAEKMQDGDVFPPINVYLIDKGDYYLTGGWHRIAAYKKLGKTSVECNVHEGTWRDAVWASLAENNEHGIRPSPADKRKKVMSCLEDEEWSKMSDKLIADQCGCERHLVFRMRNEMNKPKAESVTYIKNGKVVTQNVLPKKGKPDSEKPAKKTKVEAEQPENKEEKYDARDDVIHDLKAENVDLKDRLAIAAFDSTDEEKQMAEQTIKDLREQIRVLEIELVAVKTSRDTFQKENAEMKKQIFAMQKKLKAVEAK